MNRFILRSLAVSLVGAGITTAFGQVPETGIECIDPLNTMPFSNPYATLGIGNDLMVCVVGIGGTVTYGGSMGPCWNPAVQVQNAGKFAFSYGPQGSIQRTPSGFVDNNMALVFGARSLPSWTYAAIEEDTVRTRWGLNGMGTSFVGFSNRYMRTESTAGNVFARLQVEVVADCVRLRWTMTNTDTANPHNIGLFFGGAVDVDPGPNEGGANLPPAHFGRRGNFVTGYVFVDKNRPPVTEQLYDRALSPSTFPEYVDFTWSQSDYFGFRVENQPTASTHDVDSNEPGFVDRFWVGSAPNSGFLIDGIENNAANFPLQLLLDTDFAGVTAWCQQFRAETVAPSGSRGLIHYIRSTWGRSNYALPFGVAVDAPTTLGLPQNGGPNNTDLFQNPFPMRVYVDNVGGFGFDGKEFPLNEVRVKVVFDKNAGVTLTGSQPTSPWTLEKTIAVVAPREDEFVSFQASVDPNVGIGQSNGVIPFTVIIDAQPGFVHKEIKGEITVASRPRMDLFLDANQITIPYQVADTSLETVFEPFLDPNVPGGDIQFYKWDALQKGYVITTSAQRGLGFWAIYNKIGNSDVIANYAGSPQQADLEDSQLINLHNGFNMIANPHNYRIPINLINGVSAGNNQISRTFQEMVDLGYIQSFLSHWDPVKKDYVFVPTVDGYLEAHQAYWINVLTADDLALRYPRVFTPFVPGLPPNILRPNLTQADHNWSLKLVGRSNDSIDSDNAIGVVNSPIEVNRNRVGEPPMAPLDIQSLSLSIRQSVKGKDQQMARAFTDNGGRNEWKVVVTAKKAGDVTVNWPNISQVPKGVRLTLKDASTNISRQLRQSSGYTFHMDKAGTRELTIISEPGGSTSAVIGNVVVSRPAKSLAGRAPAPFTIAYTLGSDATTTVRVLSSKGQEVSVLTRGRADRAGENNVTWNLRNSANQSVAPGAYRVEIIAENGNGERVRRFAVVNVIR